MYDPVNYYIASQALNKLAREVAAHQERAECASIAAGVVVAAQAAVQDAACSTDTRTAHPHSTPVFRVIAIQ